MNQTRRKYVLDAPGETERLERQSRAKGFNFEEELQFLSIQPGQRVLDAGCGTGIVTDYLAKRFPQAQLVGWDAAPERLDAARAQYGHHKNVQFVQQNLVESPKGRTPAREEERFDVIVCRFVLRHFSPADGKKVVKRLVDLLQPGGTLYCIDAYGLMGDVYPASDFLRESLRKIREGDGIDFSIAKKMPALLMEQGLEKVDWESIQSLFKGAELDQEIANLELSVEYAQEYAKKLLGGARELEQFKEEYFAALRSPGQVLIYNRVVAFGTKPKSKLRAVK